MSDTTLPAVSSYSWLPHQTRKIRSESGLYVFKEDENELFHALT